MRYRRLFIAVLVGALLGLATTARRDQASRDTAPTSGGSPSRAIKRSVSLNELRPFARQYVSVRPAQFSAPPATPSTQQGTPLPSSPPLIQGLPDAVKQLLPPELVNELPSSRGTSQPPTPGAPNGSQPLPAPGASGTAPTITDIRRAEGDHGLMINLRDSDLRNVLDMLSEESGLNILMSPTVRGTVTASLRGVDVRSALRAILKSTGFVARYEDKFIYIGTPEDLQGMDFARDKMNTRIYFPHYVKAAELQTLITPLLTASVGKISVCSPAEIDIPADNTRTGGDGFAGDEVLLVRDYESVLWQVDQIVCDVDRRPAQVAIEAMILSVRLNDVNKRGIDFQLLREQSHLRLYSGSPLSTLGGIDVSGGGLKIGFLDASLGAFLDALETIGETNVIASPRLLCLNKQKAEILIGSKLGYVSTTVTQTASTQTVQFLEVGTQLRLRPFITADGMIRMEIHPELSTGNVRVAGGMTLPDKDVTEVTTNVLCQDGSTVVLGGLIREELATATSQIPYLGNLPVVGGLFRRKSETTDRRELVVLMTPRVVGNEELAAEGRQQAGEYFARQDMYADKMSPTGKRTTAERYLRHARAAWTAGDAMTAFRYANLAVHFDPLNRDANNLRTEIVTAHPDFDASVDERLRTGIAPADRRLTDYTKQGHPWQPRPSPGLPQASGYESGSSGRVRTLTDMPDFSPGAPVMPAPQQQKFSPSATGARPVPPARLPVPVQRSMSETPATTKK